MHGRADGERAAVAFIGRAEAEARRAARGRPVFGEWPPQGVTFDVRRGSFVIPAALLEDGREHDLARHYARSIPDEAHAYRREALGRALGVRIHWRIIHVVAA